MKVGVNPKADPKKLIQQIAQQTADEPREFLRSATRQLTGAETHKSNEKPQSSGVGPANLATPQPELPNEQKLRIQGQRQLQALENELEQIHQTNEQQNTERLKKPLSGVVPQTTEKPGLFQKLLPQGKNTRMAMGGKGGKKGPSGPTGTTKTEVRKPPSG